GFIFRLLRRDGCFAGNATGHESRLVPVRGRVLSGWDQSEFIRINERDGAHSRAAAQSAIRAAYYFSSRAGLHVGRALLRPAVAGRAAAQWYLDENRPGYCSASPCCVRSRPSSSFCWLTRSGTKNAITLSRMKVTAPDQTIVVTTP